jgi:hypothetical protein
LMTSHWQATHSQPSQILVCPGPAFNSQHNAE